MTKEHIQLAVLPSLKKGRYHFSKNDSEYKIEINKDHDIELMFAKVAKTLSKIMKDLQTVVSL